MFRNDEGGTIQVWVGCRVELPRDTNTTYNTTYRWEVRYQYHALLPGTPVVSPWRRGELPYPPFSRPSISLPTILPARRSRRTKKEKVKRTIGLGTKKVEYLWESCVIWVPAASTAQQGKGTSSGSPDHLPCLLGIVPSPGQGYHFPFRATLVCTFCSGSGFGFRTHDF